jgi:hypothetical protein
MRTDKNYESSIYYFREKIERNPNLLTTKHSFDYKFFAFSTNFANQCFKTFYNHKIENANNLIFPKSAYKLIKVIKNDVLKTPLMFELKTDKTLCYCGVL